MPKLHSARRAENNQPLQAQHVWTQPASLANVDQPSMYYAQDCEFPDVLETSWSVPPDQRLPQLMRNFCPNLVERFANFLAESPIKLRCTWDTNTGAIEKACIALQWWYEYLPQSASLTREQYSATSGWDSPPAQKWHPERHKESIQWMQILRSVYKYTIPFSPKKQRASLSGLTCLFGIWAAVRHFLELGAECFNCCDASSFSGYERWHRILPSVFCCRTSAAARALAKTQRKLLRATGPQWTGLVVLRIHQKSSWFRGVHLEKENSLSFFPHFLMGLATGNTKSQSSQSSSARHTLQRPAREVALTNT